MHDLSNPINIVDPKVAYSSEIMGKECATCLRLLPYSFYLKNSSYRDGHIDQCDMCRQQPKLSTLEHTARLKEMNFNSYAVKKQRWENQSDYMNDESRDGKRMHSSEFIRRIRHLIGEKLFLTDGRFLGDISVYQISGVPRPDWPGGPISFKYLWYIPIGWMPEYSIYEFDERWIPVRERERGWRTPLLRLIKAGLLSEEKVQDSFGHAEGEGSTVYKRQLWQHRQI